MEISLISDLTLNVSYNFEKGEVFFKETLNRRRKRDREPSRIPLKRILKVLNKKKYRKKVQLFVRQSIPKSSFITNLSQNHKIWRLWYNRDTFYSKYAFNMKTQKCKMRQKHCSCIHRCNNKSSLKGGMHHNTADSLWNCLSQRLAQIGLIPRDVGGSGDCFFKSVSHQLYGTADLHVEVRMAGITHLHNYPELYIESISDDTWENYIKQMSIPGTWCDHLIIQAVANAFNCVIHITESNANSLQATIITPALQQEIQHTIFIGYVNDLHYVSTVTHSNSQNINRLKYLKRKYSVSEYDKERILGKRRASDKKQLSEETAEKKQERLAKRRASDKK